MSASLKKSGVVLAAMGAALAAGVSAPSAISVPSSVVATQQVQKSPSTAPAQSVTPAQSAQYALPRSMGRFFRYQGPVWIGTNKKGARRGRSRFNYNR